MDDQLAVWFVPVGKGARHGVLVRDADAPERTERVDSLGDGQRAQATRPNHSSESPAATTITRAAARASNAVSSVSRRLTCKLEPRFW